MFLKDLCELNGVSGNERAIRDYIIKRIKNKLNLYSIDKIGNLVVEKKSSSADLPSILVCAHMDEVGLLITCITSEGYLKFQPIGGIDSRILVSKTVTCGSNGIPGIIGYKAIHLQKPEERKQSPNIEDLYIDIGSNSKEETEKIVKLGDYVTFLSRFERFGSELFKAKALDDRVGCAVIMEILNGKYDCNLIAAFTVQEEIGLRGSKVIGNYIDADLAIVLEATKAADIDEKNQEEWIVEVGKGPACSLMDSATIYKPELISKVVATAQKYKIPLQFRKGTAASNDAGNIHKAAKGIPTITISVPCRNIHSFNSIIAQKDYENCIKLIKAILGEISLFCPKYIK
jgi:putative aminopeptidase FrvX